MQMEMLNMLIIMTSQVIVKLKFKKKKNSKKKNFEFY